MKIIKVHDLANPEKVEYIDIENFYGVSSHTIRKCVRVDKLEIIKKFLFWKYKTITETPVYETMVGSVIYFKGNNEWFCAETPDQVFELINKHAE